MAISSEDLENKAALPQETKADVAPEPVGPRETVYMIHHLTLPDGRVVGPDGKPVEVDPLFAQQLVNSYYAQREPTLVEDPAEA